MIRPVFLVSVFLVACLIAACEPATPAPKTLTTTPTSIATSQPTTAPTVNARATEAVIISHVFATMTAVASSSNSSDSAAATRKPTAAPTRGRAATNPPPPVAQATPKATADPYAAQIPKGMGGILVVNYVGNHDATFNIADKAYTVPPNGRTLVLVWPGRYNYSLSVPGVPEASRSETIDIVADRYTTYSVTVPE